MALWLHEVVQTVGQERFMEFICAGSELVEGLGIFQATDSFIVTSFG